MQITKRFIFIALFLIIFNGYFIYIFGHYKSDILKVIQDLAMNMRATRYGEVVLCLLATVAGVPPMFGFTFALAMSGFIYGFPHGCIPATAGAFLSALISFGLIRKFDFARWIKLSPKKQELYQAMQDAITQGGFRMVLLIRISPLPYQLTNLILPLVPTVTWKTYVVASFIASFKFNLDVWIGSQLANLSDPDLPPEAHKVALVYMAVGAVILVVFSIWLYKLTMQKINEQQAILISRHREEVEEEEEEHTLDDTVNDSEDEGHIAIIIDDPIKNI